MRVGYYEIPALVGKTGEALNKVGILVGFIIIVLSD